MFLHFHLKLFPTTLLFPLQCSLVFSALFGPSPSLCPRSVFSRAGPLDKILLSPLLFIRICRAHLPSFLTNSQQNIPFFFIPSLYGPVIPPNNSEFVTGLPLSSSKLYAANSLFPPEGGLGCFLPLLGRCHSSCRIVCFADDHCLSVLRNSPPWLV